VAEISFLKSMLYKCVLAATYAGHLPFIDLNQLCALHKMPELLLNTEGG
jgi:hypothetical protein